MAIVVCGLVYEGTEAGVVSDWTLDCAYFGWEVV